MPSRRRFLQACTVAGLAGLAGCANDGPGDGTTTAPDNEPTTAGTVGERTGTATATATPAPGEFAWQRSLPGSISTAPVLTADALLAGTEDGSESGTVSALAPRGR